MDSFEKEQCADSWQRLASHFYVLSYFANRVAKELKKKKFKETGFEKSVEDFHNFKEQTDIFYFDTEF